MPEPSAYNDSRLQDRLVGRDLVQDLLPEKGLVALAPALEVAEGAIESHPSVNDKGAALGEGHQVDLVIAAFSSPGQGPAGRTTFVAHPTTSAELLAIERSELLLDQAIERNQQHHEPLAVVLNAPLEVEIRLGDRHSGSR